MPDPDVTPAPPQAAPGMSNSRLFCVAFVVMSAIFMVSEALGVPPPPSPWARLAINTHMAILAVAFWGDRPARKIVEGR